MIRVHTIASRARQDASAQQRADALTAAGIAPRTDADLRQPFPVLFGGPVPIAWTATPRRGYATYRVTDDATGALLGVCTLKGIARLMVKRQPQVLGRRNW